MLDQDLYSGLIRLHVLHHASLEPVFGRGVMREQRRQGDRIGPGTLYALLHRLGTIILYSAVPLVVSSLLLFFIERKTVYWDEPVSSETPAATESRAVNRGLFIAMLVAASPAKTAVV